VRQRQLRADGLITSEQARTKSAKPRWLIKGVLAAKQMALLAGAKWTLKTSLAVDLAISLATGTAFLGRFPVTRKRRVLVVSTESGESTIFHTADRITRQRGLPKRPKRIDWQFQPMSLAHRDGRMKLQEWIEATGAEVVILDPLYLLLGLDED